MLATLLAVTPAIAQSNAVDMEADALSRLRTQLIRLAPKIKQAKAQKNISRLSFDYRALDYDRKVWIDLISSYLQLTNPDQFNASLEYVLDHHGHDLNKSTYTHFSQLAENSQFNDAGSSMPERESLVNLRLLIARMKPLMREAESFSKPERQIFFKYPTLYLEHQKWITTIDRYLATEIEPSDFESESTFLVSGDQLERK